jgi:outer membrane protein insertion porin family
MVRGTFGQIFDMGEDIPIDENFYLGGISTVRGYDSRTISPWKTTPSPDTVDGIVTGTDRIYIGGDTEVVFNAEYTFPLIKEAGVKGVLFFDAGSAQRGVSDTFSEIQYSYGFGIRWFSPMGPLRLEYGMPLNPRDFDKSGKVEFSIGSFF